MNVNVLIIFGFLQFCLIHCHAVKTSDKMKQENENAKYYDLLERLETKFNEQEKMLRFLKENDSHQTDLITKLIEKNRALEKSVKENMKEIHRLKATCGSLVAISRTELTTMPTVGNTTLSNIPPKKTMSNSKFDKKSKDREKAYTEILDRTSRNFFSSNTKLFIVSESPVAFYAYLSADEKVPGPHHIIAFDCAKTNIGGAYNHFNRMFTAPRDGIYAFSWSIYCPYHAWAFTEIMVNSDAVGSSLADSVGSVADDTSTGLVFFFFNLCIAMSSTFALI